MSKVTQELIDKAKEMYKDVYVLEVGGSDIPGSDESTEITEETDEFRPQKGYSYALVRKPDKKIIGFALTYRDPIQMGNAILKNCIVEINKELIYDTEVLEDEKLNMAASIQINQLVEIGAAKLKKY